MCRNIIQLRRPERPPTDEELRLAARQYVRKITGYREPSRQNQVAFEAAIDEIARSGRVLFDHLVMVPSRSRPPAGITSEASPSAEQSRSVEGRPLRHTHGGVEHVHEA
jgi:hypothetical protein